MILKQSDQFSNHTLIVKTERSMHYEKMWYQQQHVKRF